MSDENATKCIRKRTTKMQKSAKDEEVNSSSTETKHSVGGNKELQKPKTETQESQPDVTSPVTPVEVNTVNLSTDSLRGSYWLTRIVIIRYVGFIYFVAYLVSLNQNKQLIGKAGLLPANVHLSHIKSHAKFSSTWTLLSQVPTLLWFVDYEKDLDFWLDAIAWTGLAIATLMIVTGAGNWPLLLLQWLLYHSLVNVGQKWFSFGWESQLLETGFFTVFLCPALALSALPKGTPTSKIIIFAYRWLIFRIMLGAGLIKIRGDKCWHELTCMNYHYETQPVPNPISYFLHQSPEAIHKFEVLSNHFVELLAPFFIFLTRKWCMAGGAIQILFQVALIISGNLSFLNWLTIVPSLACYDDASLTWLFPKCMKAKVIKIIEEDQITVHRSKSLSRLIRRIFNISFGVLIVYLSIPVVLNLLSTRQAMNTSFDPLRLVNTYGAFGSITKKRTEVIFQGTNSSDPDSPLTVWEEYQFKCKPGALNRRPCVISPYHYRLDWLLWFAAFQDYHRNPWLIYLTAKLLMNDENTESLIAHNPFHERNPPTFVRAEHYRYRFAKVGSVEARNGQWWKRSKMGQYLPPVSLDMLEQTISSMGWPKPKVSLKE